MAAKYSSEMKTFSYFMVFTSIIGLYSCDTNEFDRCPKHLRRDKYLRVHGDKCFTFNTFETNWPRARTLCRRDGGELITITRRDIQIFVERTLHEIWNKNGMWIGAHDRDSEMDWFWVTGEKVRSGFQNWDSSQPSCFLLDFLCHEDCACLRLDEGYKWHDYLCSSSMYEYGYACQFDLLPVPQTVSATTTIKTTTTTTTSTTSRTTSSLPEKLPTRMKTTEKLKTPTSTSLDTTTTTTTQESGSEGYTGFSPGNILNMESQRLVKDESGLKTGGMVGLVVSFIIVFIAGLIIGLVCRRRYVRRYKESMNLGFNNVLYTAAPAQETRVKDINIIPPGDDIPLDDGEDHQYTDIEELATGRRYVGLPECKKVDIPVKVACVKENVYDTVTSHEEARPTENVGGACGVDAPPPCPRGNFVQFAPDFLKKDTDVSEAYSNNLYGYST